MRQPGGKRMVGVLLMGAVLAAGCGGPKAFTKGEYDDPTRVALLDDRFNEADMQQMADTVVEAMVSCPFIRNAKMPPVVIVERVQNRTEEHIDMVSMTDKIRTALIKSGKVRFVNKKERETLEEEYDYNASGAVSGPTQKARGKQIGADYIMSGALATNVQQVGNDKLIYYKLTMASTTVSAICCMSASLNRSSRRATRVGSSYSPFVKAFGPPQPAARTAPMRRTPTNRISPE